jgi:predicted ATPase
MCTRLDRIPLALELAAAWLRSLTPQQIEAGLDDRFALLVRGPRGAPARQQTLAASIDWSHALLDEPDRVVLRRLAVFAGGFSLEAARSVAGTSPVAGKDVLEAVGRLVDKSLVVAEERGSEARYRLLETIRQYAADRLAEAGETATTRDRHLAHSLPSPKPSSPSASSTWTRGAHSSRSSMTTCARLSTGGWPRPTRNGDAAWPRLCRGCGTSTGRATRGSHSSVMPSNGRRTTAPPFRRGC